MNIKDILKESPTDLIARYHRDVASDCDVNYNNEACEMQEKNGEYYKQFFKEFYDCGEVPVFTTTSNVEIDEEIEEFSTVPKEGDMQSPGYRGKHYAKRAAGHQYNTDVQSRR